jgi:mono/diheme cytochrome c family protein
VTILAFFAGIAVAVAWISTTPKTIAASALGPHTPDLANGREMFFAGGCAACHATPGEQDRTRLGGGLGLKSPFGTFYAPNISSDPDDGIGRWSEADFVTAVLRGTSPSGEHYFPAFPYVSYQRMKLEDVRDLHAFMRTLPAVKGRVRGHDVPFPFNIRRAVGGWKLLFMDDKPFAADASKSDQWNRGAYLVNGPSHCAECHSPRNFLGGIVESQRFAGGPDYESGGWVPNITQKALGDYTEDDIAYLLETGQTLKDTVGGGMVAVIRNTSQLTDADRKAMATYLKSLPPVEGPPRPPRN